MNRTLHGIVRNSGEQPSAKVNVRSQCMSHTQFVQLRLAYQDVSTNDRPVDALFVKEVCYKAGKCKTLSLIS
jgi:hypothetical protein